MVAFITIQVFCAEISMKTEIKVEPGICLNDENKHKQMLTDAVHYAVNLLKEEGVITSTVSNVISSESEEIGREICRRVKDVTLHIPEIKFIKVENDAVLDSDLEVDYETIPQSDPPDNEDKASASFRADENYKSEDMTEDYCNIPWDMKVKAVTLATLYPKWSLKTISKKTGNYLRTPHQLWMWKQAVKKSTVTENYSIISDLTHKRFEEASSKNQPVTIRMLQNWAMEASQQFLSTSFKFRASDSWLFRFMKKYKLRECKITGFLKM